MDNQISRPAAVDAAIGALQQILGDRGEDVAAKDLAESTLLWDAGDGGAVSLGLDSLDALDLITSLEERFEVSLPEEVDFETIRTIGDAVDLVMSATSSAT